MRLYLSLVRGEDAMGVEVACHSTEGRDTLESMSSDAGNMVVETQATVHSHSQDLDVLFDWQTLASKAHQS